LRRGGEERQLLIGGIVVEQQMQGEKKMGKKEMKKESGESLETPTRVPEPEEIASTGAGIGPESTDVQDNEQDDGQGSMPNPHLVERKTALRGQGIGQGRVPQSLIRKRTERDLRLPDAEIPYFKTEKAVRDLFCSLLERQDRMNEAIFLQLNDLKYRVDDLECSVNSRAAKRSGTDRKVPK